MSQRPVINRNIGHLEELSEADGNERLNGIRGQLEEESMGMNYRNYGRR